MRHTITLLGALAASLALPSMAQTPPPAGRLLASNCFQCHGTNGSGGFERLAGKSANEIYGELREMRSKSEGGIMDKHAAGYTDAQLRALSDYLSRLGGR
jgi:cytochrome subunit of sulfide dehydrogenase